MAPAEVHLESLHYRLRRTVFIHSSGQVNHLRFNAAITKRQASILAYSLTDAFAFRHRNFPIDAGKLNGFHSSTGPSYFDLSDGRNRTKAEMQS